jgi:DNA adenine methylase
MTPPSIVKWVGSKRSQTPRLVEIIRPLLKDSAEYFEPFAGSLAPFFALRQSGWSGPATLSDASLPLIRFWEEIAEAPERLWSVCEGLLAQEKEKTEGEREGLYYRCRKEFNSELSYGKPYRAALFLYLNQRGFNGLYRTNNQGYLTTSYGGLRNHFPARDTIQRASALLANASLHCADFEEVLDRAKAGDVVYADPPYNGTFTGYSASFRTPEQRRLAECLKRLHRRGVHIIASNADTEGVRAVYHWANIEALEVRYGVKGGDKRVSAKEVLISAVAKGGAQ